MGGLMEEGWEDGWMGAWMMDELKQRGRGLRNTAAGVETLKEAKVRGKRRRIKGVGRGHRSGVRGKHVERTVGDRWNRGRCRTDKR